MNAPFNPDRGGRQNCTTVLGNRGKAVVRDRGMPKEKKKKGKKLILQKGGGNLLQNKKRG